MKATVVKTFPGAADGDPIPRFWTPGEVVVGSLAKVAVEQGWAEEIVETVEQPAAAPVEPAKPTPKKKAKASS